MFENLTERLENVFKQLRRRGKLSESDVDTAMREVRLALLEADVNYAVAKDFVAREVVKAEEVIDYTPKENIAEKLAKRFGASIGAGAVHALQGFGGLR